MILILSSEEDKSTNEIIDWLRFYNEDFLRISEKDEIEYLSVEIGEDLFDINLRINTKIWKLTSFKAFWYRRSHFNVFVDKLISETIIAKKIDRQLRVEINEIHKLFRAYIEKKAINKYDDLDINKLQVLKYSLDFGFKIPDTIITTNKSDLNKFYIKHNKKIITKNFSQGVFIYDDKKSFSTFTKLIDEKILSSIPECFNVSLFQEQIDKIFELRVFFINGDFYGSAIFSQNDSKTSVDFRNYNFLEPNRTPPFKLDSTIENNLRKLMNKIGINSGSIDLIVNKNGEYVFLEVNPIGQFKQVSEPCNYFLEEIIANQLINYKNEN